MGGEGGLPPQNHPYLPPFPRLTLQEFPTLELKGAVDIIAMEAGEDAEAEEEQEHMMKTFPNGDIMIEITEGDTKSFFAPSVSVEMSTRRARGGLDLGTRSWCVWGHTYARPAL